MHRQQMMVFIQLDKKDYISSSSISLRRIVPILKSVSRSTSFLLKRFKAFCASLRLDDCHCEKKMVYSKYISIKKTELYILISITTHHILPTLKLVPRSTSFLLKRSKTLFAIHSGWAYLVTPAMPKDLASNILQKSFGIVKFG